ncbi:MAG: hypothetical protein MJ252_29555, partial [archaeon]|nr:hypothetical protein [archaeon]
MEKENKHALKNTTKYSFFLSDGTELNASKACENETFKETRHISEELLSSMDVPLSVIKEYQDLGIDLTDENDEFFHDICVGNEVQLEHDMTLKMRKEQFLLKGDNSLCEEGCTGTIEEDDSIVCECPAMTKLGLDTFINIQDIVSSIQEMMNMINLSIFKCYNLFLSKYIYIRKNGGNYYGLISFITQGMLGVLFFMGYYSKIFALLNKYFVPPRKKRKAVSVIERGPEKKRTKVKRNTVSYNIKKNLSDRERSSSVGQLSESGVAMSEDKMIDKIIDEETNPGNKRNSI